MPASSVHIAGVGISGLEGSGPSDATLDELAIAAGAKALLDAGVTYDDVDLSIASTDEPLRIRRSSLTTLGTTRAPICEIDNRSALFTAVQCVRSGQSNCALVIGIDRGASEDGAKPGLVAVATVLVSSLFLTSHAYLKDAAICIRACALTNLVHSSSLNGPDDLHTAKTAVQTALRQAQLEPKEIQVVEIPQASDANVRRALSDSHLPVSRQPAHASTSFEGTTGLAGLCGIVWQLRGWTSERATSEIRNCLHYNTGEDGAASVVILSRSDGRAVPAWSDIENLRDGRERLGYNPALEMRVISREDLEAVRAKERLTSHAATKSLQLPVKGGDRAALARL